MSLISRFVLLAGLFLLPLDLRAQSLFVDLPAGAIAAADAMPPSAMPGTVKRSRLAILDTAVLAAARISRDASSPQAAITLPSFPINLFPGMPPVNVQITAESVTADGHLVWKGQPQGVSGFVDLVIDGIQVTGQMMVGDQMIEIRPASFGLHRIIEIEQSAFPKEAPAARPPASAASGMSAPGSSAPQAAPDRAAADSNTTINVLVVYGSRSASASTNITSEIQLAVSTSNTVYTNSGIPITLNLVGTQLMSDYDETARSYDTILNDLTDTSDGRMDTVHTLRTSTQADLVVYLTERTEYCGLAWLYNGYPQYGFAVVTRSCATSNLSFPHELGHNMGANHDRYVESGGGSSSAYNYGYVDTTARIRTVMGYNDKCAASGFNCTRIPYFSSPYLTYNGTALGVNPWSTTAAYNVRRLTETRTKVAAFRSGTVAGYTPANGWWWNSSEAGRGYSIEVSGSTLFFAVYTYASDGSALWYISTGTMGNSNTTYSGTLQQYSGGQTINGSYKAATNLGSVGTIQIYFYSDSSGLVVFPNGTSTSISRFDFITNGAVGGTATGYPQTGWWWNASEAGRGFFIEAQNTSMFVSFYMYDSAGQAVWYVASGSMTSSTTFQGTVQQYSGGSSISASSFRSPSGSSSLGTVTIQFGSQTSATMTLPNGTQVPLTRFSF